MMNKIEQKQSEKEGFTLIELSIVLVIIGLIVGGVLVGQDLIKAAELRATVSQLEKYNTAVNTFRLKYNGIPGDLSSPATFFSVTNTPTSNNNGCADGDGLVEDVSACNTVGTTELLLAGEAKLFWAELSAASLIEGSMTGTEAMNFTDYDFTPSTALFPASKGGSGSVHIGARSGRNYFVIGNPGTSAITAGNATWSSAFTPNEAYQLDTKIDDGVGGTGTVLAVSSTAPDPDTLDTVDCLSGTAYALTTGLADSLGCNLSFRASF